MNQKGNVPMTTTGLRIPVDLLQTVTVKAERAGITRSEYIRLALEYVEENGICLAEKKTFRDV